MDGMAYEKMRYYPHMKPADVIIWERFIDKYPDMYYGVQYDTPCGEGWPDTTETPENVKADWRILGQKKIDVVGFTPDGVDVIEVKPRASITAIGQAISYLKLFKDMYGNEPPARAVIITDHETPDLKNLAEHYDIEVFIV